MPSRDCDFCGHDINGELIDDTRASFAVMLDGDVYCAYCFRIAHPALWLQCGGKQGNMIGTYTFTTSKP